MKIFSNTSFKSLAAAAAVMLFASAAVYASCPPQYACPYYAANQANTARTTAYNSTYNACVHTPGYTISDCQQIATREGQTAYNEAYSLSYAACMNGTCS